MSFRGRGGGRGGGGGGYRGGGGGGGGFRGRGGGGGRGGGRGMYCMNELCALYYALVGKIRKLRSEHCYMIQTSK